MTTRLAWTWGAATAVALLLPFAIAWPLGGLADAPDPQPPRVSLGQRVKGHRLELVPRKVYSTTRSPGGSLTGRYLVLNLDVTNVSKMPADVSDLYLAMNAKVDGQALDPVMNLQSREIIRNGEERGTLLNPGLPETVRIAWELPENAGNPQRLSVSFRDHVYEPSWSLLGYSSGTSLWYRGKIMALLETQVERT
ncbi:hypothetical protein [Nonomuraea sp. SYSU D8015]|uniref:hypothetical protein n=1 Tax=Nonomuraea sp. SYSU D8015 TaxID=2593644 RepID=UPI001660BFDA|nr:hypothetical protein [Nonomuraea sp. SYSU D8015]